MKQNWLKRYFWGKNAATYSYKVNFHVKFLNSVCKAKYSNYAVNQCFQVLVYVKETDFTLKHGAEKGQDIVNKNRSLCTLDITLLHLTGFVAGQYLLLHDVISHQQPVKTV